MVRWPSIRDASGTELAEHYIDVLRKLGKTPGSITAIRPLKDGVIADFDITEAMLGYFIRKVHGGRRFLRPRVVIAVPSGITAVEKRAAPALERGEKVNAELPIKNTNRTVGATLSGIIARKYGHPGLPDGTIHFKFTGNKVTLSDDVPG